MIRVIIDTVLFSCIGATLVVAEYLGRNKQRERENSAGQ
jgi:hypothetical protein